MFSPNQKIGYLTLLNQSEKVSPDGRRCFWLCKCDCGNHKELNVRNLKYGKTQSCGCLRSIKNIGYDEKMRIKLLKSIEIDENGCWNWKKSKHRQGYGNFPYKRKILLAHRASWILFKGDLNENVLVCHKCDNCSCVNPDHLFLGNQQDNMKDMFNKKRKNHKGESHPGCKLNKDKILEIKKLLQEGLSQSKIAKKFSIKQTTVSSIKLGKIWKEI